MKKTLMLAIFYSTVLPCFAQEKTDKFGVDDLNIIVEKFDPSNNNENRYNEDNKIYKVGKKFTFNYYYLGKSGDKYLMTKENSNKQDNWDWIFEKIDNHNPNSVSQIILSITPGLSPFIQQIPDYNQTVIMYNFKMSNGELWNNEMTGVIENEKNLWIHPPRTDFFKILEINPFPYIKAPFKVGNKWDWKLKFGSHWADKRWLMWEGENENVYNYAITGETKLDTKLGALKCFVIQSEAKSNLGKTYLTSYFSTQYGFIKLDYSNIDGTKTVIEIDKVE